MSSYSRSPSFSAKIAGSTGHYHASTAWSYFRPLATSNLLGWWKIHYIQYPVLSKFTNVINAYAHQVHHLKECLVHLDILSQSVGHV